VTCQWGCNTRTADGRDYGQASARRAIQTEITGATRGRKHCPASASDSAEPEGSVAATAPEHRSADLGLDVRLFHLDSECDHGDQAGDRDPLASTWLLGLLALEVRQRGGRPRIDREIELIRRMSKENPSVGSAADTRRTADARHRNRSINRGEVHDEASGAAFPGLKDIPAESR